MPENKSLLERASGGASSRSEFWPRDTPENGKASCCPFALRQTLTLHRYEPTGFPDYKGMTEDHNDMLDGARLPGRSTAVPKRTHTQVSAQIDRAHIAHASSNKNRLTGTAEMIHTAAQGIVKAELKAQKKQMLDLASREDWGSSVQDLADAEMQDPDMYGPGAMEQAVQMAEEAVEDEHAAGEEDQIEDDDDNVYLTDEDSEGAVEDRRPMKRCKRDHRDR